MAALIAHPAWKTTDLSSLRLVATGSMIVPVPLIEAFHPRGVPVVQVYGSTETAPSAIYLPREDHARKIGPCRKPPPHCAGRIARGRGAGAAPRRGGGSVVR